MKRLVAFPLADGSSIVAEVDDPEEGRGTVRVARPGEVSETARLTFEEAMGKIRPAAECLIASLRGLADSPDEVSVQFGINLSAQAGAIIAAAGVQANYTVSLTWKQGDSKS